MIKVVFGTKGVGKTKYLVEDVNKTFNECRGDIVFIDSSNKLITDLRHEIRFVNITDFPIDDLSSFLGFISGLIAANYDIQAVYVDRLDLVAGKDSDYKQFFEKLKGLNDKFPIRYVFSISGHVKDVPDDIQKEYAM
ncbi:MAG: hypothetical protein GX144_02665 [Clostridiaceae bacterium]|jgi:hypothetical protein|nr:hypothetical protein [Clostridiaceae bacterium]